MRIDHPVPRRKIKQLQAHGQYDPSHNQSRPSRPCPLDLLELPYRECSPHDVLNDSDGDVGGHVVGVVPAPERQITDMHGVESQAKHRPDTQNRASASAFTVEAENTYWREVHAVEHARACGKVVQLLRPVEVASMEDHAEYPAREPEVSKKKIVFAQRICLRN